MKHENFMFNDFWLILIIYKNDSLISKYYKNFKYVILYVILYKYNIISYKLEIKTVCVSTIKNNLKLIFLIVYLKCD